MHIHKMQTNLASELNVLNAMQQAQAKQRAEATRRKLFEAASEIAGEAEDFIVTLGKHQEGDSRQQEQTRQKNEKTKPQPPEEAKEPHVSDWV
jgi:hypothetical protein